MNFLQKLMALFSLRDKKTLIGLLVSSVLVSFMEAFGLSVVMGFVSIATNVGFISNSWYVQGIYRFLGCQSWNEFIFISGLGLIIFFLLRSIVCLGHVYAMNRFAQNRYHVFAERLFRHFLRFSYRDYVQTNSSDVAQVVFSYSGNLSSIVSSLLSLFSESFTIVCIYAMLFWVNWKMTLALTALLFIKGSILIKFFSRSISHAGKQAQEFSRLAGRAFSEAFGNFKTIKLISHECVAVDKFACITRGFAQANTLNVTLQNSPRIIFETIGFLLLVSVVLYVIYRYASASAIIPIVSLYALAFYRFLPSVNKIFASYNQIIFCKHAVDKVHEFLAIKTEALANDSIMFKTAIELKKVTFAYHENKPIFSNVDLVINKGERVAFVGESGSGKSTMVDVIMGLYSTQSGSVFVDGMALTQENFKAWRNKIGYVPQSIYLFDGTVGENVAFGRAFDEQRVSNVLKKAHVYDDLLSNNGIYSKVGDCGIMLSGGQRQRIALARALYDDPEVLVFDEATSSLDHETESKIMEEIYSIDKNKTLIIVAHRLTTVEHCEKIYKIDKGRVFLVDDIKMLYKRRKKEIIAAV
jgi:ABC-type multidrug transport system fused ATPase/permease subunit